jgi:hypothetical protein
MMFDSPSAFDQAAKQPFLGEPAKKKWSLASASSSAGNAVATMLSEYYNGDDDDDESTESVSLGEYEAPEEVVVFQEVDIEAAIVQERHSSFVDINQNMNQILAIQNDLSALVDSQGADIDCLEMDAAEAADHATSGVEQLLKANQAAEAEQNRTFLFCLAAMVVVGAFWSLSPTAEDGDGPNILSP